MERRNIDRHGESIAVEVIRVSRKGAIRAVSSGTGVVADLEG